MSYFEYLAKLKGQTEHNKLFQFWRTWNIFLHPSAQDSLFDKLEFANRKWVFVVIINTFQPLFNKTR